MKQPIEVIQDMLPDLFDKLAQALSEAAGQRVAVMVLAAPYDEACKGDTRAVLFCRENPINQKIMIDGAVHLIALDLAQLPNGKKS